MPKVDFHTHSTFSDGTLDPERLAALLASRGARYAALTDHDTTNGSARFREALALYGIGCIDGVEFTAKSTFGEVHLLVYSAGPLHPDIVALLPPLKDALRGSGLAGLAKAPEWDGSISGYRAARPAIPSAASIIKAARDAGAAVYLAHPLTVSRDATTLEQLLDELIPAGLDGIESIYGPYGPAERAMLLELASRRGIAVSAGSDLHEPGTPGSLGVEEMEESLWRAFRGSISGRSALASDSPDGSAPTRPGLRKANPGASYPRRFAWRVAIPASAVVALFVVSLFAIIIPQVRGMLLEHKKETIRDVTESVVSILAEYDREVRSGLRDLQPAQLDAAARIRDIRYGSLKKDYLWITDTLPRMIMHPYRPELDGQDLRDFRDGEGVAVFVEFVRAASSEKGGYVEYLWQWEDEANRIVPKLSYVTLFEPWDWIIGTGVYLEDVNAEISALTRGIGIISIAVSALVAVFLAFMVQQSLAVERARQAAESAVRESRERYRILVEVSREGMAIVMDGAFTFANASLLEMTGYSEHEFFLLSADEVLVPFPDGADDSARFINSLSVGTSPGAAIPAPFACALAPRSGQPLDVLVTAAGFGLGGREGVMLTVRKEGVRGQTEFSARATGDWDNAEVGAFSARWSKRAGLLRANSHFRSLLGIEQDAELSRIGLFSLFPDRGEELYRQLESAGVSARFRTRLDARGTARHDVLVTAFIVGAVHGDNAVVEGIVEDITPELRFENARKKSAANLAARRLGAMAPASAAASKPVTCGPDLAIIEAARRMQAENALVMLIVDNSGRALGYVTERDLAWRVVAAGADPAMPVYRIMSAPLRLMPASTSLTEARATLRQSALDWTALEGASGSISGIVRSSDLEAGVEDRLSPLLDSLSQARSVEELADARHMLLTEVETMVEAGAKARPTVNLMTEAHDRTVRRLVSLAVERLGEPPCPWAFVALGSAGRGELLPGSDQDNAIVFEPSGGSPESNQAWFLKLGEFLCRSLEATGMPLCSHGLMAMEPEWCAPRVAWEARYDQWVGEPEPELIVNMNALIDIRTIAGDDRIIASLRDHLAQSVAQTPAFLVHLANGARNLRIPALPIVDALGAKEAAGLFPAFARVYALRAGLNMTGTFSRLEALAASGALWAETAGESSESFEVLLRARLCASFTGTQLPGLRPEPPPAFRGRLNEALLRAALSQAAILQKRIGFDFLGTSG